MPSTPSGASSTLDGVISREPATRRDRLFCNTPNNIFGIRFPDGSRRCFMVEIDRGTMPITRTTHMQTSIERKMRAYLATYAAGEHERRFGWKTFRVLIVTTEARRMRSMMHMLNLLRAPGVLGASQFFFVTRQALQRSGPLTPIWQDSHGRSISLT